MSDDVIAFDAVVKTFGSVRALDGLNLRVSTGEVHGFLGPNGSGKSTAMRVLLGMLRHDSGTVTMLGANPWTDTVELHRRLAYVPGEVNLWPNLTGGEVIDLLARMRGGLDEKRRAALLDHYDLDPTKKVRTYSKGNRQKVALVAAFSSHAELLLLDEPTSGLDPLMESVFQKCVGEAVDEGATVLLSSHILAEVEALCQRVSIIREGATVQTGSLSDLRKLTRTAVAAETLSPVRGLSELAGVRHLEQQDGKVSFDVETDHLDRAISLLGEAGLQSLKANPPSLEELFMSQYGDEDPA